MYYMLETRQAALVRRLSDALCCGMRDVYTRPSTGRGTCKHVPHSTSTSLMSVASVSSSCARSAVHSMTSQQQRLSTRSSLHESTIVRGVVLRGIIGSLDALVLTS